MLAYDPASNLTEWVPMWSMSVITDVCSALGQQMIQATSFLCPHPKAGTPKNPVLQDQSAACQVGEETDSDSWKTESDSEEWVELEHVMIGCAAQPLL